jgi:hypothetical protein
MAPSSLHGCIERSPTPRWSSRLATGLRDGVQLELPINLERKPLTLGGQRARFGETLDNRFDGYVVVMVMSGPRATAVAVAVAIATATGCSGPGSATQSAPASHSPGSQTSSPSAVSLRQMRSVVVCPTDFPAAARAARGFHHRTMPLRPPAGVNDVVVYTDSSGVLRLVGPRGWRCNAGFGENLSGGLIVYPAGERIPVNRWAAGWHLGQNSKSQAISVVEDGLSPVQGEAQACPYFPAARKATLRDLGHDPCALPSTERVRRVDRRLVDFEDPAGAPGGGIPSGGRYRSLGAATYQASATPTGYLTSCTVAKRFSRICAADLNPRRDP